MGCQGRDCPNRHRRDARALARALRARHRRATRRRCARHPRRKPRMSSSSFGIRGRTRPRASSCEEEDKAARRPRRARQALWMLIALLLCFAFWQFSSAALIHAKAIVAQRLIASAWAQARGGGPARRPWPWADMRPIARMRLPARQLDLYVFDNA